MQALVIGGGSGIGAAVAAAHRERGDTTVVWDVAGARDVDCDISQPEAIEGALAGIEQGYLPRWVTITAGVGHSGLLDEASPQDWDRVMAINARGPWLCMRGLANALRAAGQSASIVATSSVSADLVDRSMGIYCASKAALSMLVQVAAAEWGPDQIRVNAVAPGVTATPMLGMPIDSPWLRDVAERTALGRVGTADDIASAVLALHAAPWVTGHVLRCDGGLSLRSPIDVFGAFDPALDGPTALTIHPATLAAYAPDAAAYRGAAAPMWVDELDLAVTASHVRMGTRALDLADWLQRDDLAASELALRQRLLAEQRQHVLACTEAAHGAAAETARLVEDWLHGRELPALSIPTEESHPLARAALAIQEDLCLMVRGHGTWRLEGGCVCFPSRWSLAEKMGGTPGAVHAPVAHYAEELAARVDTFFDRLSPDKPVWRRNLSLWPACLLWVPTPEIAPELWDPVPADPTAPRLWLRTERQTLRRLPDTGAILFTIRVQMAPLSVLSGRPERARAFAAWWRGAGGESRRRELGALLNPDLAWLDRVGATRPV